MVLDSTQSNKNHLFTYPFHSHLYSINVQSIIFYSITFEREKKKKKSIKKTILNTKCNKNEVKSALASFFLHSIFFSSILSYSISMAQLNVVLNAP